MYESFREEAIKFRLTEVDLDTQRDVLQLSALAELILIGLCAAMGEGALFIFLSKGDINLFYTLLGHVCLVCFIGLWVFRRYQKHSGLRIGLLLLISTAFLGPFGAIGTFISVIMFMFFQRTAQSFMEWYNSIFPEEEIIKSHELHLNLLSGRERPEEASSVSSFIDIIARGNTKQKQAAIQIITHHFNPRFAPSLKLALKDTDSVVRVQAASAVAAIERKYVNKLHELEEVFQQKKDFLSIAELADHLDEYANLGLMDKEREKETRQKSLSYYLNAYEMKAEDRHIVVAIGRLLLKQDKTQEALNWYKAIIEKGYISSEIICWAIECLFKLEKYAELRRFIFDYKDHIQMDKLQDNVRSFIQLWHPEEASLSREPQVTMEDKT